MRIPTSVTKTIFKETLRPTIKNIPISSVSVPQVQIPVSNGLPSSVPKLNTSASRSISANQILAGIVLVGAAGVAIYFIRKHQQEQLKKRSRL